MSTKKYKCPYCETHLERPKLIAHIEKTHEELIPNGYTATRVVYDMVNKTTCGKCRVCGKPTNWNESSGRYDVLCGDPKCKQHMRDEYKKNMLRVKGTYNILNDPEQQTKMLANRSISGQYKFQDGGVLTYTGSYEKKCLEFMDVVMQIPSKDIMAPGPTLEYVYNGSKHFYITDFYYIPYNLIIEVKDGSTNFNKKDSPGMRASREKTIEKERLITDRGEYNYIRLTNNEFSQLIEIFMNIKQKLIEGIDTPTVNINESEIILSNVACMNAYGYGLKSDFVYYDETTFMNEASHINSDGDEVPEVCPVCGGKIGVYLKGEPVYLCSNCDKYFGTVPFNAKEESYISECKLLDRIREKISSHNWKKQVKKNDYKALTKAVTPYIRKEVRSKAQMDKFYNNNDFILECVQGSDDICQGLSNVLAVHYDINTPVEVYVIPCSDFNKIYDLYGDNAYQNSMTHIVIPLSTLKNRKDIVAAKSTIGARYFNDVVDNNEFREYLAGRHKYSEQIQWLIDYNSRHESYVAVSEASSKLDPNHKTKKTDTKFKFIDLKDPKADKYLKQDSYCNEYSKYIHGSCVGEIAIDEDNDKIAGYIFIDNKKYPGFITPLVVIKKYRGYGLGSKLLNDAIQKYKAIDLVVDDDNEIAIKLYKNNGFVIIQHTNNNQYWMKLSSKLTAEEKSNIITEGRFINEEDIYYNKEEFDSGEINLCFITGHSGSGKSTMGRNMASSKVEHYELDDVIWNKGCFTMENFKEYGDLIYSFFKGPGKKYYCTVEDCRDGRFKGINYEKEIITTFVDYAIKYAKSHKNTKFVIEGVWLYMYIQPEHLTDCAVYIKGTSAIVSRIRAAKRDCKDVKSHFGEIKAFCKNITNLRKWSEYFIYEKDIQKYRKYFSSIIT